jgi:hypothetical protein
MQGLAMRTKIQARARIAFAAGGILVLAWCAMGAAPYVTTTLGLTNSAPQFTVNRLSKGDRLPIIRLSEYDRGPVLHSADDLAAERNEFVRVFCLPHAIHSRLRRSRIHSARPRRCE